MKRKHAGVIVVAALAFCVNAALAEIVWVKTESADLRAGKGAIYDTVYTAKKGQPLEVIAHDGHWLQIKIDDTHSGWVFDGAISTAQVKGDGGFNLQAGTVGTVNTGAASKGLSPSATAYASNKNFSPAPLQHLEDLKHSIPPAEWEAFAKGVQPGK